MSVDFFDCCVCNESVCKCGEFVGCNCGRKWCSDECAETDGFEDEHCKLGYDDSDDCEKECWNCDNQIERSCNYCREDDFEDDVLLEYVLDKHLNISRQDLIDEYKELKGGQI